MRRAVLTASSARSESDDTLLVVSNVDGVFKRVFRFARRCMAGEGEGERERNKASHGVGWDGNVRKRRGIKPWNRVK